MTVEKIKFVQCCSGPLEAAYGEIPKPAVDFYFAMLGDLDAALLASAVAKCICELKWLPKIAEIRQAAADVAQGGVQELTASEAWGLAYRQIRRIDFEIPHTLARAMESVPPLVWEAMQNVGLTILVTGYGLTLHKLFTEAYNAILTRDRKLRIANPQVLKEIEQRRETRRRVSFSPETVAIGRGGRDDEP